jgi:hypothetical protein
VLILWGLAAKSTACSAVPVGEPRLPSSLLLAAAGFYVGSSTPFAKNFPAFLLMLSSGSAGYAQWASYSMAVENFPKDSPTLSVLVCS